MVFLERDQAGRSGVGVLVSALDAKKANPGLAGERQPAG